MASFTIPAAAPKEPVKPGTYIGVVESASLETAESGHQGYYIDIGVRLSNNRVVHDKLHLTAAAEWHVREAFKALGREIGDKPVTLDENVLTEFVGKSATVVLGISKKDPAQNTVTWK